jgi:hypothetical protein
LRDAQQQDDTAEMLSRGRAEDIFHSRHARHRGT